ncbi:hypothetical protein ACTXT7_002696 [Hymenolepis weldensis]
MEAIQKITDITAATKAFIESTSKALGRPEAPPKFESLGGTRRDDAALQNLQARCRLVAGYLTAQLLPQQSFPPLLMLSSANLDEALCGYLTKYDCSSADLNPIGSISKEDLRRFLEYFTTNVRTSECSEYFELASVLNEILAAQPTAELTPLGASNEAEQNDETDIGLTYAELSQLGTLRKKEALGPVGVFERFMELNEVKNKLDALVAVEKFPRLVAPGLIPTVYATSFLYKAPFMHTPEGEASTRLSFTGSHVAVSSLYFCELSFAGPSYQALVFIPTDSLKLCPKVEVKLFFRKYSSNRHKSTVLPPSLHMESYSADDNRFDLRPFLYRPDWPHQFERMDEIVANMPE